MAINWEAKPACSPDAARALLTNLQRLWQALPAAKQNRLRAVLAVALYDRHGRRRKARLT